MAAVRHSQEGSKMLEVQNLRKSYGHNVAVDGVNFLVPDGQIGVLLGPNGAGKSTIIKSIAGLLRYQGIIRIQGIPARRVKAKKLFVSTRRVTKFKLSCSALIPNANASAWA